MKVSVCVITYNHELFIEECLISILSQKIDFEFEVIIGEDGSKDNTKHIIQKIQNKYPGKIQLLPDEGNLGMMPNFIKTLNACTGEYIAVCEGDDYWTDPNKLQKQVDFLENNQDYVACYTDIQHYFEKDGSTIDIIQDGIDTINISDLFIKNYVTTLTAVFRNGLLKIHEEFSSLSIGDWPLFTMLSQYGKIKRLPLITGVYRIHDSNYFQAKSYQEKKLKVTEATEFLYRHLHPPYRSLAGERLVDHYYVLAVLYGSANQWDAAVEYYQKMQGLISNAWSIKVLRLKIILFLYRVRNKIKL
ncbi:MAG: glycosyltransferase [Cyclobacteriaceae bacterium]|nr:glycosyltransferase [Cyclobacteriaceae bacterium]